MTTTDHASLRSLAFLYLTFSHATDGSLAMEEMRTLASKVQGWAPGVGLDVLGGIIKEAMVEYKAVPDADKLATAHQRAGLLKASAPDALAKIVADLEDIANADGSLSDAERTFIEQLRAQIQ